MNCGADGCVFEDNTSENFDAYETDATTERTRKNIFSKLSKYMQDTYGKKGITNSLLKLQGISSKDFDYVSSVENFMLGNLTSNSINPNANKCETNMMRVMSEAEAPFRKLLGYDLLYRTCKRLYGKEKAEYLMNRVFSYDIYICDSTAIPQVYCWAINGTDLVIDGRNTGSLHCSAPQHLFSYISMLCGTMHTLSQNALAGACACGTVFYDSAYLLMKDGYTLDDIKNDLKLRKYIKNLYQNLIYDLSDTTRVAEPPFTNISIFDSIKIRAMVENLSWLYEMVDITDIEYITNYVLELQDIYCEVFDFGNPLVMTDRGVGDQFEFPVTTVNLSKDPETAEVMDKSFLKKICKLHIERYNIMTSNGSKVSSCCFTSNQKVVINTDKGVFYDTFKNLFDSTKYNFTRDSVEVMSNGVWKKIKSVIVDYDDYYYKIKTKNGKVIIVTKDHLNPTITGDISSDNIKLHDCLVNNSTAIDNKMSYSSNKYNYFDGFILGLLFRKCNSKKINTYTQIEKFVNSYYFSNDNIHELFTKFIRIDRYYNKYLNLEFLRESIDFRKGILDGIIHDGLIDDTISSKSNKFIETIEILCTSLGVQNNVFSLNNVNKNKKYCLSFSNFKDRNDSNSSQNYQEVLSIEKVKGSSKAYCVEIIDEDNPDPYFVLPNGIVTHNCRLSSDMMELVKSGAVNSFGGSGAMSIGSHRVILPNIVRFAIMSKTYQEFLDYLKQATEDVGLLLKAHKELLLRERNGGLQPYMDAGLIDINKLFSTFGFIGLWEAYNFLSEKKGKYEDIAVDIIKFYNNEVERVGKELGLMVNIEQVPGETIAVKFAKADALIFGKSKQPHILYSNQYIPLTEPVDMFTRMELDGKLNKLVTGGGIVHITSGEYVSPDQAEKIIEYASKCGNEFFAINVISSICGECGNITVGKVTKCKHCGGDITDYTTRVVGFKTLVSNWIPERKIEFEKRFLCDLGSINNKNTKKIEEN